MLRGEGRGLRFRHELARLAVERAVPAGRRVALHRQILAHLVVTSRDEPARLAHHAEEAGMAAAVLEHATAAAERAAPLGATGRRSTTTPMPCASPAGWRTDGWPWSWSGTPPSARTPTARPRHSRRPSGRSSAGAA